LDYDAVIVGGGVYGCCVALHLRRRGLKKVLLIERGEQLLQRASFANQARLHNGYHYPRSFRTAARSRKNFQRFARDFPECISSDFRKVYCIAKPNSKVGRRHFEKFCRLIGAPLQPAPKAIRALFSPNLIERVYDTEEYAFDADILRQLLTLQLDQLEVERQMQTTVTGLQPGVQIEVETSAQSADSIRTPLLFNCTYAGLNYLPGARSSSPSVLKHEITEITLVEPPQALRGLGITVMDGPFFSLMPFPARKLHSFTHVRYTPHFSWIDDGSPERHPYRVLEQFEKRSNFPYMLRDAARFLPSLAGIRHVESIFEVKTVLVNSEVDDSRPILFDQNAEHPNIISILGGKIDNIYDILDFLDQKLDMEQRQ